LRVPGVKGASLPPANITSASPRRIARKASPTATADEEQAVEKVSVGPDSPCSSAIQEAAALFMDISTV
jgi:hypothetical protein